jgi:hypothetical protein
MQATSALTHTASQAQTRAQRPQRALAGSKSLASMLPTILTSGVITLAITAVLRLVWVGFNNDFFAAWMEAWLTTWPIAFPLAYLSKPWIYQVSSSLSVPVENQLPLDHEPGLTLSHVNRAAELASIKNQLRILNRPYIHQNY